MTSSYKELESYRKYVSHQTRPRDIPPFEIKDNMVVIPWGEVFCRFPTTISGRRTADCEATHKHTNFENLRTHIIRVHGMRRFPSTTSYREVNDKATAFWNSFVGEWENLNESGLTENHESGVASQHFARRSSKATRQRDPSEPQAKVKSQLTNRGSKTMASRSPSFSPSISPSVTVSDSEEDDATDINLAAQPKPVTDESDRSAHSSIGEESDGVDKSLMYEQELEKERKTLRDILEEKMLLQDLKKVREQIAEGREEIEALKAVLGKC